MQNDPTKKTSKPKIPKKNNRDYNKMLWSLEEKKTIFYWYNYSRLKEWGRSNSGRILMEKLKKTDLRPKIEQTTTAKIYSLCSVIDQYLKTEEITNITKAATDEAIKDHNLLSFEEKEEVGLPSSFSRRQ